MNTKGRKLLRYAAGFITAAFLIVAAYTTTAMASGIGLIDTADLLDIHAEADDSSAVVGQVMDEGHVAILGESDGWVQIQAGDIIGWVPEGNLIVTEVSNEEAVEANEELFAEIQESAEEANEKAAEDVAAEDETAEEILKADTSEEEEAMRVNASEAIEENADVPSEDRKEAAAQQTEPEQEMAELSAVGQGAEDVEESSEEMQTEALEAQQFAMELQKEADAQKLAAELQKKAEAEAAAVQKAQEEALRAAEAAAAQKAQEEALRAAEAAALEAQRQAEAAALEAQRQAEAAALEAQRQAEAAALEAQRQAEAAALEAQRQAEAAALESRKQNTLAAAGVTEEELYLLANIIYCEAGCEPYIGKVAVGNVVMNRVKSDKQPDTISEVVYAKGQFSPVSNGSLARALKRGSADESCYQAALEALEGASPVGDKLFFRRVNGRSGQVIGHHVFY